MTTVGKSNGGHGASFNSGDPYQGPHGSDEPVSYSIEIKSPYRTMVGLNTFQSVDEGSLEQQRMYMLSENDYLYNQALAVSTYKAILDSENQPAETEE
ncbi:hypothetical protein GCM10009425_37970 [Pseudomonas asuensis]|uniref:Uncharacterized protein n=1 Tax=Pseudomonas asuensis TaxID=1825787 RepID=A0ABQ2H0R1_9PSED|nr:hypothetical protein GCM10009425_37970 [Pseudomonas asuensis]